MTAPRLVISDIDGTLLNPAERVAPRTAAAIGRLAERGVIVTLATGRPHRWLQPVVEQLPIRPRCVAANGAVIVDTEAGEIVETHLLEPATMSEVVERARGALASAGLPGLSIAVELPGEYSSDQEETFHIGPGYLHAWQAAGYVERGEAELLSAPAVKLLLRNEHLQAQEFYDAVRDAVPARLAHLTFSMREGLLEVMRPGVNKQLGAMALARHYSVDAADVACFGDMPNDREMIAWAGWGVAMGNAHPELKAIANEVTGTNAEDGVAAVLERWV
ncbi:Cof-type HAD-IIB family hydrolase [Corynebacterium otitidis]|uniref:Cof-type HAD-IIB family hydrolase n=1 Tax=Corynebacterium otitidis TaxID=29321 RepID=UPI0006281268|nr:Cof-type HAD-IIB family hydrolase [Corynebacterium otitidis]KKO83526.1 HAD family hydrolase [Corynebacterium otitidis]